MPRAARPLLRSVPPLPAHRQAAGRLPTGPRYLRSSVALLPPAPAADSGAVRLTALP
ncbi:hypothetical protein FHX36_000134 [Modestobacter versicolor]|uniref:Uncharacterized protein n=1 Tax=Modestobacter versicolor TaxID=429133 RepID=A0A839XUX9_9ACTN|nr:hypothetical protein [Modestobacter versicolor]MBB3674399.1 hypothetical protein [Modestobacter versicolor]